MAGTNAALYIKAEKSVEVTHPVVTLGDVLSMECTNPSVVPRLKTQKLIRIPENGRKQFAVSILKVIERIHEMYPGMDIQNIGESDFIVTYENQKTKGGPAHLLKTAGVVLITFFGAAFSIMSFNNDVSTPKLFGQVYEQVTGMQSDGFTMLEASYSVGITIGILVFFNHFGGRRFSTDPTPMEVEMRLYENDIETTLIETYSRKGKEIDVD